MTLNRSGSVAWVAAVLAAATSAFSAFAAPAWFAGSYDPVSWSPLAGENFLAGHAAEMTGSYYVEGGRCVDQAPLTLLTDGEVPRDLGFSKVVGLMGGVTLSWTLDEPCTLEKIRVTSRWCDSGRDGIGIDAVLVRGMGSSQWTPLSVSALAYGLGSTGGSYAGTGALWATLSDPSGPLADGVIGIRLVFGPQDNDGTGYVEIEAVGTPSSEDPLISAALAGGDSDSAVVCADLRWPGMNADSADFYIRWGEDGALSEAERFASGCRSGERARFCAAGLQPATRYSYCVFASNSLGRVSACAEGSFTTLAGDVEPIRVNEVCATGDPDWFEIYNPNVLPVDLTDWRVTDDPSKDLSKWKKFPSGASVPAEGYLVVLADGTTSVAGGRVHVDLGLSSDGESVALAKGDGTIVSRVDFPEQVDGVSYGLAQITSTLFDESSSGTGFSTTPGSFVCTQYNFTSNPGSVDEAEAFIADSDHWSGAPVTREYSVVTFNEGGGSVFDGVAFPGNDSAGACRDGYAVVCTGDIVVPEPGDWTFACGSDDGFRCAITGHGCEFAFEYNGPRGYSSSPLGQFNFPAAGVYSVKLVFFENTGGAACDFSVAKGYHEEFSTDLFSPVGLAASGVVHAPMLARLVAHDVSAELAGATSYTFTRTFDCDREPAADDVLRLGVRYADGFVAELNGVELARVDATTPRASAVAREEAFFEASAAALRQGANTLTLTLLRSSSASADALLAARLELVERNRHWGYMPETTPGAANSTVVKNGPTPELTLSEPHGYKTEPFDLAISCPELPGAPIYYTLDGTAPTTSSAPYREPLHIESTTVLRAMVVDTDSVLSRESVATFIFLDQVLAQQPGTASPGGGFPASGAVNGQVLRYGMRRDLLADPAARGKILRGFTNSIATISIVIDPENLFNASTGIYVNCSGRGRSWERPGMVEQIDPVRGAENEFTSPMGLRIRGAASRNSGYPKHSFRLFFRGEYGRKSVAFPFFGDEGADKFKRMDLRCSQNYAWANAPYEGGWLNDAIVTEVFERDAMLECGQPSTRSRFCNLFVNGQYWGLYQTQERADDNFAASYLGGEPEDYDTFNVNELNSGSSDGLHALYGMAGTGFADAETYLRAQGLNADGTRNPDYPVLLDVTNLVVRALMAHYAADGDSPCSIWGNFPNNYFAVCDHTVNGTGFKWFCHDGEHSLGMGVAHGAGQVTDNPVGWGTGYGDNPLYLNARLMDNAEYRMVWADHVYKLFFGDGPLTVTNSLRRFRRRMAEIDDAVVNEAARWGVNGETYATWTNACEWIQSSFIQHRLDYLIPFYRQAGWYPAFDPPRVTVDSDGASATLSADASAVVYYTTDGSDPRAVGGAPSETAVAYAGPLTLPPGGLFVRARAFVNGTWSALGECNTEEHRQPPPLVAAEKLSAVDASGAGVRLAVTLGERDGAGRLFMAWGRTDGGDVLSDWAHSACLADVSPSVGRMVFGAPDEYGAAPGEYDFVRFFLADEASPPDEDPEQGESALAAELASVTGDGSQWIDLDFTPAADTRCQIKFKYLDGHGGCFVGTKKGDDVNDWRFFSNKDKGGDTLLDFPSNGRLTADLVRNSTTVYEYEFGNFYVKDLASGETLVSGAAVQFPDPYANRTYLFSPRSDGSYSYGTVYYLRFYNGAECVRDYVPARDPDGRVCLYEKVGKRFFYPEGGALAGGEQVGEIAVEDPPVDDPDDPSEDIGLLGSSETLSLVGSTWLAGGDDVQSTDVAASLRVAEIMSVPVIGGSDGAEYVVLTNRDAELSLWVGGVRVTCTKDGDEVAKCDFTLPSGTVIPAGGSLLCAKADFWPDGKITDGSVNVAMYDSRGVSVQRLFVSTKWDGDVFRMCDGKGAAFVATSFESEVPDESCWRPSIPDIADKSTRKAVAEAITATPALQDWLRAQDTDAVASFRGDADTLTACYLVGMSPTSGPAIALRATAIDPVSEGRLAVDCELTVDGEPWRREINGTITRLHYTDLGDEPVDRFDCGRVLPLPADRRNFDAPSGGRHFYKFVIE